ncbi:MAG: DUF1552 domain-containing protein [Planctomycetaceae bacterium]|nr:DUF1552 domain-containing protein [Planctomycetaceae bacterium]
MNPIFRKRLSRRTMLKGTGVALGLPFLDCMIPALNADQNLERPPLRNAFLFMPNGVNPENFTPPGDEESFELTPMLQPLAGVKDDLLLLENLWNEKTVGRNGHWPKVPAFLSGGFVVRTSGRDMDTGGTSVDQVLAQEIGSGTPLPSLELGVDEAYTGVDNIGGGFTRIYGSHIAWRDPHTPVPKEIIPRLAFDRLFRSNKSPVVSGFTAQHPAVAQSLSRDELSVLDLVREDASSLRSKIGTQDRAKMDEYLESVRSIERRIENSLKPQKRWINNSDYALDRPKPGIPDQHLEHVRLMLDILVLGFWTDTTRVATFMFGNAQTGRNFSFIEGVKGSFHGLSHHRNEEDKLVQYEKIGTWHLAQLAYVIERMKALPEADGTLLDHSLLMFGSTLRDGNSHDPHNLPIILAGRANGAVNPGRRIRYAKDTPLCNLYRAILAQQGITREHFGDSNGMVDRLA